MAGGLFALATVPGAATGALITAHIQVDLFQTAFGLLLLTVAVWLLLPRPARLAVTPRGRRTVRRLLTDAEGDTYFYSFDPWLGFGLGLVIGVVASLFGVGGGIFFVPAMVLLMRVPVHVATATSTFILVFTAGTGALVHLLSGHFKGVELEEISLAVGVLFGAQLGAIISRHLAHHQVIVARLFSAALVLVSLRLLLGVVL